MKLKRSTHNFQLPTFNIECWRQRQSLQTQTMKKHKILIASALIIFVILSGCAPMLYTMTPPVNGHIYDSANMAPIQGASVTMFSDRWDSRQPDRNCIVVSTDNEGAFSIPEMKKWGIWFMTQSIHFPSGCLSVQKNGYSPYIQEIEIALEGKRQIPPARRIMFPGDVFHYDQLANMNIKLDKDNKDGQQ